jgi:gliding motility-associated lipoprotein GldB
MRILPLFLTMLVAFALYSCGDNNRLDVDVSSVQVEPVHIKRMEKDLFNMNPDSIQQQSQQMLAKYGQFYVRFITSFINDGGLTDSTYGYNLKRFISDKDMRTVYDDCMKEYPDLSGLEAQLTEAFRHYQYHFPNRKTPPVATLISGFNYSIINSENTLGIGLDMYLGRDYKYYEMMYEQLPLYRRANMRKEYILPDCLKGWMMTEHRMDMQKSDLLSNIIHQGKILYLVDAMVPKMDDSLKIGYNGKQMEWCRENEHNMWAYFLEHNMLYSTNASEIQKFISEGPFTAAFNKESPGQVGVWMGWQIVRSYMDKNPDITLEQLMNEKDAQRILTRAKYKPAKS